jgi:hypothetical protein
MSGWTKTCIVSARFIGGRRHMQPRRRRPYSGERWLRRRAAVCADVAGGVEGHGRGVTQVIDGEGQARGFIADTGAAVTRRGHWRLGSMSVLLRLIASACFLILLCCIGFGGGGIDGITCGQWHGAVPGGHAPRATRAAQHGGGVHECREAQCWASLECAGGAIHPDGGWAIFSDMDAKPVTVRWRRAGAVRYGEADHPGPARADNACHGNGWATIGCASYKEPGKPGFHHAFVDDGADYDECGDDVAPFSFKVDSCNCTSWTGAQRYLRDTEADVVLLQEHHLPPARIADASAWALRRGWHSLFLPAEEGNGGGWRAGVAIVARPHVGLGLPKAGTVEVVPSRVMMASIEPPGFRKTTVLCAYLEDGKGVSAANLRHYEAIGVSVDAQGEHTPCIAGGDWQADPDAVASTGFAGRAGMALVATKHPRGTYRAAKVATELDYFFPVERSHMRHR